MKKRKAVPSNVIKDARKMLALLNSGATGEEIAKIFYDNAKRKYLPRKAK